MSSDKLKKLAENLIHYYIKSISEDSEWEIALHDKPVTNFLKGFWEQKRPEFFHEAPSLILLETYLENLDMDGIDVQKSAVVLVDTFDQELDRNAQWHWVVVPLVGARLYEDISFQDFRFISGNEEQKIAKLAELNNISIEDVQSSTTYLKTKGSPDFFSHPLFAVRVKHQTEYIMDIARLYAFCTTSILQVLHWSRASMPIIESGSGFVITRPDVNHLIVYTTDIAKYNRVPLIYKSTLNNTNIRDLLSNEIQRESFVRLFSELVSVKTDPLEKRFLLGMRYFVKAITLENSKDFYGGGISLSILHLVIAAEVMFLDKDHEKRSRLTVLLPKFSDLDDVESHILAQAISNAYEVRSNYVHAGETTFLPSWLDNVDNDAPYQNDYALLKRMLASFIRDIPAQLDALRSTQDELIQGQDDVKLQTLWFKKMREEWKITIGLVPCE